MRKMFVCNKNKMSENTFLGDGGGWRFFIFSSFAFFDPSFSDKTTKK